MKPKPTGIRNKKNGAHATVQHKLPFYGGVLTHNRSDTFVHRLFYGALAGSLLLHILFVLYATRWEVGDVSQIEANMETLFRVNLRELSGTQYTPRQTAQQLRQEQEQTVAEEIEEIATLPDRSALHDLEQSLPNLDERNLPSPETIGDFNDGQPAGDSAARSVITSDVGKQTVTHFENRVGEGLINDWVETQRRTLLGRGGGSSGRVTQGLPKPELTREPLGAGTITLSLTEDLAPPVPDLEVAEPPIELPPDTELLPSPDIMTDSPASVLLPQEAQDIQQIQEKFVILDDLIDIDLFTYHHIGGDGYFVVRIRPKAMDERLKILNKDVIFVLDASGSMGRISINNIKVGIEKTLERLRPDDRFNVVGFRQQVRFFTTDFVTPSSDSLKEAKSFIRGLNAHGKTDIYSSLRPLVEMQTGRARPVIVLLLSDGRPNVGIVDSRRIINELSRYRAPNTSIFSVGTGTDINRYLLDLLTFRNRGRVWFEPDRHAVPDVISSVFRYIENPVLMRIQARFANVNESEVYPKILPDLYLNGEIRLWGRLQGETEIPIRLVGEAFDEQKDIVFTLPVPELDNGTYEIARDWARSKIYHIAGKMVYEGEKPEYHEEIRFLSQTYRVQSPYSQ